MGATTGLRGLVSALGVLAATAFETVKTVENRSQWRRKMKRGSRASWRARAIARMKPHGMPTFVAICRPKDRPGRRYFTCVTRDQALEHKPYMIEHVNGWGQVTRRERFDGKAAA